jgi:mono/diheme cytochrome c family protein
MLKAMNTEFILRHICIRIVLVFLALPLLTSSRLHAQSKPWPVPAQAVNTKSPVANNPAALKDGKTLYQSYCTPCHGEKGKGDGPAAAALNPKPADHTSAVMLNETDGSLFFKMSEGRTPMPAYKAILNETQRWDLVAYIRTLNKNVKK